MNELLLLLKAEQNRILREVNELDSMIDDLTEADPSVVSILDAYSSGLLVRAEFTKDLAVKLVALMVIEMFEGE